MAKNRLAGRMTREVTVTIANGAAVSEEIDMREYVGGAVRIPAAWTAANLGIKVSPTSGGTFIGLKDDAATPLPVQVTTITTNASYWYDLPDDIFAAQFIQLWSKSADNAMDDAAQGADRTLVLMLKG